MFPSIESYLEKQHIVNSLSSSPRKSWCNKLPVQNYKYPVADVPLIAEYSNYVALIENNWAPNLQIH